MDWYLDRGVRTAVTELRREIKAQLVRHADASPDELADAELIAGELLANAVDHSQGPIWVSLDWTEPRPTLVVRDMGTMFTLPVTAPDVAQPRGRGLWLVSQLAPELSVVARRAGKAVEAVLPVTRSVQPSVDPPRRTVNPLPHLEEANPEGGFGRESFLRALVVQLTSAVEDQQGLDAAQHAVAQVAADIGGQMEQEYRHAIGAEEQPLSVEQTPSVWCGSRRRSGAPSGWSR